MTLLILFIKRKIYGYLPTAGEMKWSVLERILGEFGYGR